MVKVFMTIKHLGGKGEPTRYSARFISRGHGTEIYRGHPFYTEEKAKLMAYSWLRRNPEFIDTTKES